jgi:outer membrane protein assembly factor BamB
MAFPAGTALAPIAPRATSVTPDLGYAYDALDYLLSKSGGSQLVLTNGVAVGFFGSYGIAPAGAGFTSCGLPQAMNHLCWYPSVQEQPIKFNNVATPSSALFSISGNSENVMDLRFTDISLQGERQAFFDNGNANYMPIVSIYDCTGRAANFSITSGSPFQNANPGSEISLQNNAWSRSTFTLFNGYINYIGTIYQYPLGVFLYNNLFWSNTLSLTYDDNQATSHPGWTLNDNLFDGASLSSGGDGHWTNYFSAGHNAYYKTPTNTMPVASPIVISNLAFDFGPLGQWYSDSNTVALNAASLINTGSRSAAAAGLTNETLFTNLNSSGAEIPDSGTVDIGFHHVATDTNGEPVGCQPVTNTNTCLISPFLTILAQPFVFNGHATNTFTAQVTLQSGVAAGIIVLCDGTYEVTNNIELSTNELTILSNWNIVTWNGVSHTNLNTLTWTLPFTNGGIGTNTFYVKYSDASPCGGVFTNSLTATFAVASWITALPNRGDAFGPGIDSSPALSHDGSTVYIESTGNFVYAINVTNGAINWSNALSTVGAEITSSPTVTSNGSVLAGSAGLVTNPPPPLLFLTNAVTHSNWSDVLNTSSSQDNGIYATPAVTPNGTIYIGTDEGDGSDASSATGFWSVRATNGSNNWFFQPDDVENSGNNGDIESSAAVGQNGTIYFLSEASRFYALDANGNVQWFIPFEGHTEPDSSPAIGSDGAIYIGSDSPYVYALNPDGSIRWTFHVAGQTNGIPPVIYSSPAVDSSGTVYVGVGSTFTYPWPNGAPYATTYTHAVSQNFAGVFYALTNGAVKWAYTNANGEIASSPVLASNGTVYVGARVDINPGTADATTNGMLLALSNGVALWTARLPGEIVSSPLLTGNGTLIFGCEDGNVYAIPTASQPATNAPWPTFHHDAQHTGCVATNSTAPPPAAPFPSDGTVSVPAGTFSFSIVGSNNTTWAVLSATNLTNSINTPANLGTITLTNGTGSFTDPNLTSFASRFYYLSNNGICSRIIGYIAVPITSSTMLISDPFAQVDDNAYFENINDTTTNQGAPMNSIASLFPNGSDFGNTISSGTVAVSWAGQAFISETNVPPWEPQGDIMLLPGAGVLLTNISIGSSSPSIFFAGIVRTNVTLQTPKGTNFLGSPLPIAGGVTTVLGFTNLSWGDTNITWNAVTSQFVTNAWTNNAWHPNEPLISLGQGFIMISTNSHTWTEAPTNLPNAN